MPELEPGPETTTTTITKLVDESMDETAVAREERSAPAAHNAATAWIARMARVPMSMQGVTVWFMEEEAFLVATTAARAEPIAPAVHNAAVAWAARMVGVRIVRASISAANVSVFDICLLFWLSREHFPFFFFVFFCNVVY